MWQVGDASQLNGNLKIQWYKAKDELMAFKIQHGITPRLYATDIVPLVNKAFKKSFFCRAASRKAVAERGWYPPTMKILQDPLLKDLVDEEQQPQPATAEDALLDSVNLSTGAAGNIMTKMLSHAARKDGTRRRHLALQQGQEREAIFQGTKKITSGLLIAQGLHSCNNPALLEAVKERERKKKSEENAKKDKEKARILTLKRKLATIREKKGSQVSDQWNKDDCRTLLQFKKRKKEPAMPKSLEDLRARCNEWQHRPSPNPSPCTSDTEEHEENDTHPNDGPTDDSNDENIDDEEAFGPMIEL
jgi:hypothetical protein